MSDAINVHRLRLAAPGRAAAGLAARVEDALRTASRPPALVHAFLLVRHMRVTVPRNGSAQTIALQLEREWSRLLADARPIDEADEQAHVVWAAHEGAARQALLTQWLRDEPTPAWFWQRLAPQARADDPLPMRIAELLCTPWHDSADVAAGPPRWWRQAMPLIDLHGHIDAVMAQLPVALRLRVTVAWQAPRGALSRRAVAAEGEQDERCHPGAPQAAAGADPRLPGPADAAPGPATHALQPGTLARAQVPGGPSHAAAPPPVDGQRIDAAPSTDPLHSLAAHTGPSRQDTVAPRAPERLPITATATSPDHGQSTAWAGLWYLLPLLQRQGFAHEAAGSHAPAAQHHAAAFTLLLQALGARHGFDATVQAWLDALVVQHLGGLDAPALEPLRADARQWLRTARGACLRDTRLPLRRVLRRPGQVLLGPHRWDIVLPLRAMDVRIRRAGYDIDPGYLPWLDVVVRFHYE